MGKSMHFSDGSGDKQYFTIIPNYIANHSTANDQALYFQMKKHAGEKGSCYLSEKTLKEKLGIGGKALKKSIQYLLDHGWIKENGYRTVSTIGGNQKVKSYSIVDIWNLNAQHYNKGVSKREPLDPKGVSKSNQRGALLSNKEDPITKKKEQLEETPEQRKRVNDMIRKTVENLKAK